MNFSKKLRNLKFWLKKYLLSKPLDYDLEMIKRQGKHIKGSYKIAGNLFSFPDSHSFYFMYREILVQEIYKFKYTSENGSLIIDCGANIGLSSIYFLLTYPEAQILAFEPDQKLFNLMKENIHNFDVQSRTTLVNAGVWSKNDTLKFYSEGSDSGRLLDVSHQLEASITEIKVVELNAYLTEKVAFLKIDIEGAETEVLKSIQDKLYLVQNIFIEFHSFKESTQSLDVILEILTKNGFRYFLDNPTSRLKHPFINSPDYLSMDLLVNIYATKI